MFWKFRDDPKKKYEKIDFQKLVFEIYKREYKSFVW